MGFGLAVAVGYVNTHTDETGVVAGSVLVASGLLGLVEPRGAWRWGLLVGLSVPVGQAIFHLLGARVPYPNAWSDLPVTLVALVPALIGAYAGSLIRTSVTSAITE
jgi:hypothetical protein